MALFREQLDLQYYGDAVSGEQTANRKRFKLFAQGE